MLFLKRMVLAIGLSGFALSIPGQAATLTVNNKSDTLYPASGCTLRGAVAAINNRENGNNCVAVGPYGVDDTVIFYDDNVTGSFIIFTSAIEFHRPMTIKGPASARKDPAKRVTLIGGGSLSNFNLLKAITSNTLLTVEDLNFVGGTVSETSTYGGAIDNNNSNLIVRRCAFSANYAREVGGAIRAWDVHVEDSLFSDNMSQSGGGAISAQTATIINSAFLSNSSVSPINNCGGPGGAIDVFTLNVVNSTFSNNTACTGGAIAAYQSATGRSNITNSTFNGNSARNGGALYIGDAHISASTFVHNAADQNGGAIFVSTSNIGNTFIARHLTLADNMAMTGPAVYLDGLNDSRVDITNSLIISNEAKTQCIVKEGGTGIYSGSYNLGWAAGGNDISCGGLNAINAADIPLEKIVKLPLIDNGGPTMTVALPADSPAIGKADISQSLMLDNDYQVVDAVFDQRGHTRKIFGMPRDLGAYEWGSNIVLQTYANGDQTVYGAYVPSSNDAGKVGSIFVAVALPPWIASPPNDILVLDVMGNWQAFTGCHMAPALYTGTLQELSAYVVAQPMDLSPIAGAILLIGSGLGNPIEACENMINLRNWTMVYSIPESVRR